MRTLLFIIVSAVTLYSQTIGDRIRALRQTPDSQRGLATKQLALDIRALPPSETRTMLAGQLTNLSTEGDFGMETLQTVADTLADSIRDDAASPAWHSLASLVRYEGVRAPFRSPTLDKALDELKTQDESREQSDFTLQDLTGRTWTLKSLRGKVVLVNFWATWCPPCRKEMPDLNALYKQFKGKGLVVLSLSDEEESKVRPFIADAQYSFPVLLDKGGEVAKRFAVQGIPKSFFFNREGKLAAQSIDMRTRSQFLKLLAQAGMK